jgi:hypothetical protein
MLDAGCLPQTTTYSSHGLNAKNMVIELSIA